MTFQRINNTPRKHPTKLPRKSLSANSEPQKAPSLEGGKQRRAQSRACRRFNPAAQTLTVHGAVAHRETTPAAPRCVNDGCRAIQGALVWVARKLDTGVDAETSQFIKQDISLTVVDAEQLPGSSSAEFSREISNRFMGFACREPRCRMVENHEL